MNIVFISNGAGFNTNGVTCLDWLESPKIEYLPPEYIKNSHEVARLDQLYLKSLKSPLNQFHDKIITYGNKLQSSEVSYPSFPSVDTAGGPILPPIPTCTPSAVTPIYMG